MKPPNATNTCSSSACSSTDKAFPIAPASTWSVASSAAAPNAPSSITFSHSSGPKSSQVNCCNVGASTSTGSCHAAVDEDDDIDLARMLAAIDYDIQTAHKKFPKERPFSAGGNISAAAATVTAAAVKSVKPKKTPHDVQICINAQRVSVTTSSNRTYTARVSSQSNMSPTEQFGHTCTTQQSEMPQVIAAATTTTAAAIALGTIGAHGGACGGVKRKLQPIVVQNTQNVLVNGRSAVDRAVPGAKKEVGICSLKDDQYRIKKILTKKAALAKAQQCAAKLTVPTAAAKAAGSGCTGAATTRTTSTQAGPPAVAAAADKVNVSSSSSAIAVTGNTSTAVATTTTTNKTHPTTVTFPPPPPVEPEGECVAERSIKSLLEYIEGGGTGSAAARRELQKKAAKKAKQKLKRLADKHIEELEALRSEFHGVFYRESEAKLELKQLKAGGSKKRDKRRMAEVEAAVKRLGKLRQQLEAVILERIAELKATNSEFKFAYLPSKEQLLEQQVKQQADALAASKGSPSTRPTSRNSEAQHAADAEAPCTLPKLQPDTDAKAPATSADLDDDGNTSSDAAKRMVTIRRVIVPNADQQVTVTSKGPSPDQDEVLCTFVNGQMVILNPTEADNVKPVDLADVYHQQHDELRQQNLRRQMQDYVIRTGMAKKYAALLEAHDAKVKAQHDRDIVDNTPKVPDEEFKAKPSLPKVKPLMLTGKAKKKAEKKARKSEASAKSAAYREQQQQHDDVEVDDVSSVDTISTGRKLYKSTGQRSATPGPGKIRQSSRDKSAGDVDVEQLTAKTQKLQLKMDNAKTKTQKDQQKRKVKAARVEYADPEYRNNKFDVLDMDDDDYYLSESESERSGYSFDRQPADKSVLSKLLPLSPIEYTREVAFTTVRGSKGDKSKAKHSTAVVADAATPLTPAPSPTAVASRAPAKQTTAPVATTPIAAYMQTPSYARPLPTPQPIEIQLSKKQKKKLAQQQTRLANSTAAAVQASPAASRITPPAAAMPTATNTSSFVQPTETMAQKLKNAMQRLSINDDTTIELVREHAHQARMLQEQQQKQLLEHQMKQEMVDGTVSIIDQLKRGVMMEGLQLPPGITLTRVDPEHAEQIRAKRESIQSVCQPLQSIDTMPAPPAHLLMPGAHLNGAHQQHVYASPAGQPDASGIIMVDTGKLQRDSRQQMRQQQQLPTLQDANIKKNKKNRRRNKNKKETDAAPANDATTPAGRGLITLRNPMFHPQMQQQQQHGDAGLAMPPGLSGAVGAGHLEHSLPRSIDTPASITKNANGMFTIRNPAMHPAMHHAGMMKQPPPMVNITALPPATAAVQDFQPLSAYMQPPPMMPPMSVPPPNMTFTTPPPLPPVAQLQQQPATTNLSEENFSFFSDHQTLAAKQAQTLSGMPQSAASAITPPHSSANSTLPIGSEIKNAIQRKQMSWQAGNGIGDSNINITPSASGSSGNDLFGQLNSFGSTSLGNFNSDFVSGPSLPNAPPGLSGGHGSRHSSSSRYFSESNGNNGGSSSNNGSGIYGGGAIGTYGSDSSALGGGYDSCSMFGLPNGRASVGPISSASSTASPSVSHQLLHTGHRQSPPVAVGNTIGNYFNRPSLAQQLASQQQQQQPPHPQEQQQRQGYNFLGNLQAGQRLNSEVTIHNVNESKFNRTDISGSLANNGVEITRIGPPAGHHNHLQQQQHQQNHNLHQHRQSPHRQMNMSLPTHGHGQQQPQHQHHNSLFAQQYNDAPGVSSGSSRFGVDVASGSGVGNSGGRLSDSVLGGNSYGLNHSQAGAGAINYMGNEFAGMLFCYACFCG